MRQSFTTRTAEGRKIIVPDVPMERCDACGDTTLTAAAAAIIDAAIAKATNRLSRRELQAFLDQYHLTQKQAEKILGLGEKMISRWLKGPTRVSESMSNYIRLLMANTGAFETLRNRQWLTLSVSEDVATYQSRRTKP